MAVEQAHFRTKTAIEQALLLRGHADFVDEASYEAFVRAVIERKRNAPAARRLADERPHLRPLPAAPVPNFTTFTCVVRRWSTIRVGKRTYSVPSRLIGHTVEARQHPTTVEVRYRGQVLETMPRLRGEVDHRIDYRHIIGSLVRKPGAFARYRYREELFPSTVFRQAYDQLLREDPTAASRRYLQILEWAGQNSQSGMEEALREQLDRGGELDLDRLVEKAQSPLERSPELEIPLPDLGCYDALLAEVAP